MIGLKELILLAFVVLALYGRTGVLKSRQFRTIWPWISPFRRPVARSVSSRGAVSARSSAVAVGDSNGPSGRSGTRRFLLEGNRLFWFLTILAATALAAWIVTKTLIVSGGGAGASR
ncbi:MAG TPA: hypothetical protein VKA15_24090 [Isosphaeraceae bacterium]|nr:hypothetical protein [Isosphaeraceae bacterium]